MKRVHIEFGVGYYTIPRGHKPSAYHFYADAICHISGSFGIPTRDNCKCRYVEVELPDWIVPSSRWMWPMSVDGVRSTSGDDNLAFVTCNETAEMDVEYFGSCDQDALIDKALSSGLTLHYPTADGSMATMPVYIAQKRPI